MDIGLNALFAIANVVGRLFRTLIQFRVSVRYFNSAIQFRYFFDKNFFCFRTYVNFIVFIKFYI